MKRYLLDTAVFLWNTGKTKNLGPTVRELLASSESPVFVSAVTSWEIAIKSASGKLRLPEPVREFVRKRLAMTGFLSLPITHEHGITAAELPQHHRDPFGRILVAQAQTEDMVLITSDRMILKYSVETLAARS